MNCSLQKALELMKAFKLVIAATFVNSGLKLNQTFFTTTPPVADGRCKTMLGAKQC